MYTEANGAGFKRARYVLATHYPIDTSINFQASPDYQSAFDSNYSNGVSFICEQWELIVEQHIFLLGASRFKHQFSVLRNVI